MAFTLPPGPGLAVGPAFVFAMTSFSCSEWNFIILPQLCLEAMTRFSPTTSALGRPHASSIALVHGVVYKTKRAPVVGRPLAFSK